jgi:hypothetical protein
MAFFFRIRFKLPDEVKNKGEAAIIVRDWRLKNQLGQFYDGETIELIDEPKGFLGSLWKQVKGK